MKHIVHIIPTLERGGAEQTLVRLITHTNPSLIQHSIICLIDGGPLLEEIRPYLKHCVIMTGYPWRSYKIIKHLKQWKPDVVQTWMYHPNVLGGIAAKISKIKKIFWNIRITKLKWAYHSFNSFLFYFLGFLFSYFIPNKIVYCSESGIKFHEGKGYCKNKSVFIPNGLDTKDFITTPNQKISLDKKLKLGKHTFVIGMLARFHPQKDFETFFKAADLFSIKHPHTKFVLAGHHLTEDNPDLLSLIPPAIRQNVILLGNHSNVKEVFACLDLFTLASMAEGFPNVVAEAMASGIPAVASDVGDAALIIGNTGWIVPPRDPAALEAAWEEALKSKLQSQGTAARKRIEQTFSLQKMIDAYTNLYLKD